MWLYMAVILRLFIQKHLLILMHVDIPFYKTMHDEYYEMPF